MKNKDSHIDSLLEFLNNGQSAYQAIENIKSILNKSGFVQLFENEKFDLSRGSKYYVIRNSSSIIAFDLGNIEEYFFNITASHSDSTCFKIKENCEVRVKDKYVQINTEGYGGMLLAPWFDRPLSVAGRIFIKQENSAIEKLVAIDRDLLIIPNLAIHMNRSANDGYSYNKQVDMLPLFGDGKCEKGDFINCVAKEAGVDADEIISSDLFLYNRTKAVTFGSRNEFICGPRLDDLECSYGTLMGFLDAGEHKGINVFACFDNEEVGSVTLQGAGSTFLSDILKRINISLNKSEEDYLRAVADSMMLSCDNAHAVHPNHPEKSDATNGVYMNEGIVIKTNANQKYTSGAGTIARFKLICEKAEVPYQVFANRSDVAGGSTLGNIAMANVSVKAVDIGLPQLAMHSPYETAGAEDIEYLIKAVKCFYSNCI